MSEFWFYFFKYAFILTYISWGIVVAIEALLLMSGSKFAKEWVRKRYTLKFFMFEVYIFFPMILLGYIFLEVIPYLLGKSEDIAKFDIAKAVYNAFNEELDELNEEL